MFYAAFHSATNILVIDVNRVLCPVQHPASVPVVTLCLMSNMVPTSERPVPFHASVQRPVQRPASCAYISATSSTSSVLSTVLCRVLCSFQCPIHRLFQHLASNAALSCANIPAYYSTSSVLPAASILSRVVSSFQSSFGQRPVSCPVQRL